MGPFKSSHPFGVSTKRFANIGYHPELDPSGALRKMGGIGPGHYKIREIDCSFKKKRVKDNWTRKLELEEYSRTMGFKNTGLQMARQDDATKRGPGWYDISETMYKPCEHNIYMNFSFGMTKRFKQKIKNNNPGPGVYGIPQRKLERKEKPLHQFTKVPPFEWDGFVNRFKKQYRSWELPCNRYDVKDYTGINATLSKVVSKRGPYDMFTGPRDTTTIKGYFAPPSFKGAKTWPRNLPGTLDRLLKSKSKANNGVFFKAKRMKSPRNLNEPGPAHYDLNPSKTFKQTLFPFNCSVLQVRPTLVRTLQPGPGRYKNRVPKCFMKIPINKYETWQFKSKTGRTKYVAPQYNAF